jgi:ABC-2 type transport system permease protein
VSGTLAVGAPTAVGERRPGARSVLRVELAKLLAQTPARVLPVVCVLAPFAFVAVLAIQSAVPQDTLFGRWVHTTGFAVPLVVLGFAGAWGLPVIAGVAAGDSFAGEDRHGTWKTLLTRSCRRSDVFVGKTLAAFVYAAALVALLAASSIAAGVLTVGAQPLVGLSGQTIAPGHSLVLVVAGWAAALLPVLAFTSLAVLFSVVTRSSVAGVLGPLLVALVMQLLSLVGSGEIMRALLLSTTLDAWHGLFVAPAYAGPLEQSAVVSAVYVGVCLGVSWLVLRRRDFAGTVGRRGRAGLVRGLAVVVAVLAVLAVAGSVGPTPITAAKLQRSLATTFGNLVVLQQTMLGRHVPAGASLNVMPACRRRGVATPRRGPGDNWLCTVNVVTPSASQVPVNYDVTVRPNGCYTAEGPPSFIGPATIRERGGRSSVNPLFQFDGCFDAS